MTLLSRLCAELGQPLCHDKTLSSTERKTGHSRIVNFLSSLYWYLS